MSTSVVTLASLTRTKDATPAVIPTQPAIAPQTETASRPVQSFEWVVDTATRRVVRRPIRSDRVDATLPSRGRGSTV